MSRVCPTPPPSPSPSPVTGAEQVTYVADSGQELFSHTYGSILQCCIAIDGISFAYIARREKDNKYLCHVFQALTYEEVSERARMGKC